MKRTTVVYALLLMGFTGICTQVILIRDLIVTFSGNELAIGIFLSNWLIAEAGGSFFAGRFEYKIKNPFSTYAGLQWFIAFCLPLSLYATRVINSALWIIPGEVSSLTNIIFLSFLILLPIGLAGGAQFSIGTRILPMIESKHHLLTSRLYRYEAIGSLFGGFAVTYLFLAVLDSDQSVYLLALLNSLSAVLILRLDPVKPEKPILKRNLILKILITGIIIFFLIISLTGNISRFQKLTTHLRWPAHELIVTENSIYGNVALLKRADQFELMANGLPVYSFPVPDIAAVEDLVHFALLSHQQPKEILLIGGASRTILGEILKHHIQHIDYVEIDPLIIEIQQRYIDSQSDYLDKSPKITAHFIDGRYYLRNAQKQYDVILLNLPDPSTLELNRFYTREFFTICAQRLTKEGILLLKLSGSESYMNKELIQLHNSMMQTIRGVIPYQKIIPDLQTLIIATADSTILSLRSDQLIYRWQKRQINARSFSAPYIQYKLDISRQQWYRKQLDESPAVFVNADLHPAAVYYNLSYNNLQQSPAFAYIYQSLGCLSLSIIVMLLFILFLLILFLRRRFSFFSHLDIFFSILTSGFAGMGLTVLMVLLFQSLYGYIYFWIGLILASFMAGLAWGSHKAGQVINRRQNIRKQFQRLEYCFIAYFILLVATISLYKLIPHMNTVLPWPQSIILIFTISCGFLVGFQFPLATNLYAKQNSLQARAAGVIYAADLTGAWSAGIFITLVAIPILGILQTIVFLLMLKLGSTIIFAISRSS